MGIYLKSILTREKRDGKKLNTAKHPYLKLPGSLSMGDSRRGCFQNAGCKVRCRLWLTRTSLSQASDDARARVSMCFHVFPSVTLPGL